MDVAKNDSIRDSVFDLISKEGAGSGYIIVNMSIMKFLVERLNEKQLNEVLSRLTASLPTQNGEEMVVWLKTMRTQLGLTQEQLASKIRERGLTIYTSDIGNIETGSRKNHYSNRKISELAAKVYELYGEKAS